MACVVREGGIGGGGIARASVSAAVRPVVAFEELRSGADVVFIRGGGRAFVGTGGAGWSGCKGADGLDVVEVGLFAFSLDSSPLSGGLVDSVFLDALLPTLPTLNVALPFDSPPPAAFL